MSEDRINYLSRSERRRLQKDRDYLANSTTACQCEAKGHKCHEDEQLCGYEASAQVQTPFGVFRLCPSCEEELMPELRPA